jgi:arginine N-succinyltransferase
MNILLRPIALADLKAYQVMTEEAPLGFNTMPKDKKLVKERIERSIASFNKAVKSPEMEMYLFVAVDQDSKEVLGISGIEATTGGETPLAFYRKEFIENNSSIEHMVLHIPILKPISYLQGPSKLCSLYVRPQFRTFGIGKLLSFARFLFIAGFSSRFTDTLFADLRGVIDKENNCPFWDGIGRHFFDLSFVNLHKLLEQDNSFIMQFLPQYPIYISLLPKEIQETIGTIDHLTQGAFNMLTEIGFGLTSEIDILDGGPKVSARKEDITVVKNSKLLPVIAVKETAGQQYLISNERTDYRAKFCTLIVTDEGVLIDSSTASALQVQIGDNVRVYKV